MKHQRTPSPFSKPRIRRRDLLRFMGGASVFSLLGCFRTTSTSVGGVESVTTSPQSSSRSEPLDCMVRPQQTEGPYFVDEALNRSDIRTDPSDGSVSQGMPLQLTFHISQVSGNSCIPLEGAVVDIWQCDASGIYSDSIDRNFNTKGQKFLRGSQITDASGMVEFMTIYPGWYPGRAVHIHFKIRNGASDPTRYEFTSQLYFDEALTNQVFAQAPYNSREQRNTPNDRDRIYQSGGEQLMLQVSQGTEGYTSKFNIGLQVA